MQHLSRADQVFKAQPGWVSFAEHARQTADFVIDCLNQGDQAPMYSWNLRREQAVLDAWCELVHEGSPRVCNGATIAGESSGGNLPVLHLIYSGTALDALTAGLAATP